MNPQVKALVDKLELLPHPEGGLFREIYRSVKRVSKGTSGESRSALTAIYFLLASGQHSRWHRVLADEQWTFLEGEPLELFTATPDGAELKRTRLGPLSGGNEAILVVPPGHWQAARAQGSHALVTCTVAPGFDFADFQFLAGNPGALELLRPILGTTTDLV